jgi:AcrR family transcriptional regulator
MAARAKPKAPPKTDRGERTRRRILDAAQREIGRRGFVEASISSITAEAGVGQGTFYLYFQSKEEVLRELVTHMGRMLRQHLTEATAGAGSRIKVERKGLKAFIEFVRRNPDLYRIVEESQFVDEQVYRRYYMDFAATYRAALTAAETRGEIRPGNAEVRAWALMGIAVFLGQRYGLWDVATPLEDVIGPALDLIARGIQP